MTEERSLVANLVPKLDDEALNQMLQELGGSLSSTLQVETDDSVQSDTPTVTNTSDVQGRTQDILDSINSEMADVSDALESIEEIQVDLLDAYDDNQEFTEESDKEQKGLFGKLFAKDDEKGEGLSDIKGNVMAVVGAVRMVFDVAEEFIKTFRRSSPLLDNVLNLIENAWNLVLAPIATAIGIKMIPLVEEIYTGVYKTVQLMWEAYENEGIVGMIKIALGGIGDIIKDCLLWGIEALIGAETVEAIRRSIDTISGWLPEGTYWALFTGFLDSINPFKSGGIGGGVGAEDMSRVNNAILDGIEWLSAKLGFGAEGGYVEASPSGTPMILGEAGQREYIIPESKVSSFAQQFSPKGDLKGTTNVYITIDGYTDHDLTDKIVNVINSRTELSDLRSGF